MTRINAGVAPSRLTDQHLLAEYKEILRVFTLHKKNLKKDKTKFLNSLPKEFKLGTGHVMYFLDKIGYIENRFYQLVNELKHRQFKPTIVLNTDGLSRDPDYRKNIVLLEKHFDLIHDRIIERVLNQKIPIKYHKVIISKESYLIGILRIKEKELIKYKLNQLLCTK